MARKKAAATNTGGGNKFDMATELMKFWKTDSTAKSIFDKFGSGIETGEINNLVNKLTSGGLLNAARVAAAGTPTEKVLLGLDAIKKFQGLANITGDGVVGRVTRRLIHNFEGCNDNISSKTPTTGRAKGSDSIGLLFYTLEDSLRDFRDRDTGASAKKIVAEAIHQWHKVIDCMFVFVENASDANVVMQFGGDSNFGRPGGVLGVGTIGGPGKNMQLTLKLDQHEPWTADTMMTTVMHEFGHNLGIVHPSGSGALMSAFKDPSIKKPTAVDIELAQALWGAPQHRDLPTD